jgi:dGTPase
MVTREQIEQWEEKHLSPLAMKSKYSRGRKYPEVEHPYRSLYQRDRDRIIHCAAFRRLEYKTQVFIYHEGDYYRTRLTHTLEVSQIGRTIAKALSLNEDLTEALCLAHDLGHTPFGHAGEDILNELMKDHGGFDHNRQGLRVVDFLEQRYPNFPGLNLAWETREGIIKHTTRYDDASEYLVDFPELEPQETPSLEAQVMDIADEIAYDNHDLDDGIKSKIISIEDLKKIDICDKIIKGINSEYTGLDKYVFNSLLIRNIINEQVSNLVTTTDKNIKESGIKDYQQARQHPQRVVAFSKELSDRRKQFRDFLYKNVYFHWKVAKMSDKAQRFLKDLFRAYCNNKYMLHPHFQQAIAKDGVERVVCDYIAGMTDRYALEEYKKLFDPHEKI